MKQFRFKTLVSLLTLSAAFLAASLSASGQTPAVSIDVKDVSVKELLKTIENESGYTFAYVDSDINLNKTVSINAKDRSISSIIAEVLPGTKVEVKDKKVILTSGKASTPPRPLKMTMPHNARLQARS